MNENLYKLYTNKYKDGNDGNDGNFTVLSQGIQLFKPITKYENTK